MAVLSRSVLLVTVALLVAVNLADAKWFRIRARRRGGASREDSPGSEDGRLDKLEEMIEKQQDQIDELQTNNTILKVQVDLQADKIKDLEEDIDILQDDVYKCKDATQDLAEEVEELKKDKDDLKDALDSQGEDISALKREVEVLGGCCTSGDEAGDDGFFIPLVREDDVEGVVPK